MKKLIMIFAIWFYSPFVESEPLDSVMVPDRHITTLMYHNLDAQLRKAEQNLEASIQAQQEGMLRIERRLERMEDKFDKYFLWGYGTLLSIFIGVLAWMLNRIKIEQSIKIPQPPSSNLKVSRQKYLFPS